MNSVYTFFSGRLTIWFTKSIGLGFTSSINSWYLAVWLPFVNLSIGAETCECNDGYNYIKK